jgi:hypothetical protein
MDLSCDDREAYNVERALLLKGKFLPSHMITVA